MPNTRIVGFALASLAAAALQPWHLFAQGQVVTPAKNVKYSRIQEQDLKQWLTYLASDELEGRQTFTEGYGLAAAYVADHLREWRVKPLGPDGTYYQRVPARGYRVTRHSSVTVTVNGQSKTFAHGDHVTFPVTSGGKQVLTFDGAEFVGYGITNAAARYDDFLGRDVRGKLVVTVAGTPKEIGQQPVGRLVRSNYAVGTLGAAAAIAEQPAPPPPTPAEAAVEKAQQALADATSALNDARQAVRRGGAAGRGAGARGAQARGRGAAESPDLTTTVNVENLVAPQLTADDTFYDWLFSGSSTPFAEIKAAAGRGDALPMVSLSNVRVSFTIDNSYEVVSSQFTKNVVGLVEGTDPVLKNTYVLFGAHLDHIGYSQTGMANGPNPGSCRQRGPDALEALEKAGKTPQGRRGGGPPAPSLPFDERDLIYNGADDDGSGSVTLLGIAKAFAAGPKPKRSVVFVWHAGEEGGLRGSRYNADFPIVPLDAVQAQLNIDMVGRDDCNNLEGDYTNSVFVIGADRISTDLHNLVVATNETLPAPLVLDYEMNDPKDPESVYTRSDHFSYAAKGIPIAFFTTGLHPDYHRASDTVEKIGFPKMARIAQLIYESGFGIANSAATLQRDNKGPRTGFGFKAAPLPR